MVNLNGMKSIEEFLTCEFETIFEQWNDPFDSIWLKMITIIIYAIEIFASLIMLAFVVHETRGLFGHYRTLINQLLSYLYGGVSIILCTLLTTVISPNIKFLKFSKSQKHIFWKITKEYFHKINLFFWAMEFQERLLLRFTDL